MPADYIWDHLRAFVFQNLKLEHVRPEEITPDLNLFENKVIDSVDVLELILAFEDEYDCELPQAVEDIAPFASLRSMTDFLRAHLQPREIERIFGPSPG